MIPVMFDSVSYEIDTIRLLFRWKQFEDLSLAYSSRLSCLSLCHVGKRSVIFVNFLKRQGFYNFEATQVVECLYQPPNLSMDQQSNPHTYQPPSLFSNRHDSPNQAQLLQVYYPVHCDDVLTSAMHHDLTILYVLQDSLFRSPFQDSTQRNQWRQVSITSIIVNKFGIFFRLELLLA